ncbi:MAG: S1/P1 nuclease [Bacteroidota bacterium]
MKAVLKFLIVTGFILQVQQSKAWGVTGHRVVGEIAQRHLTKSAKKAIREIIGQESLALWSNWPDFIKSDTTHTWDKADVWHYVDLPGHISRDSFIAGLKALPGKNLYTQIPEMLAQVKDTNLSLETRRNALAFLVHLIGDLHQPLHVGRDEDQGGNKIALFWFDAKTNLHSLWDTKLVDFQQYSFTEYATAINTKSVTQVNAWQQSSLEDWFYESHVLSDKVYDLSPVDSKQSYKYNYVFKDDLDAQLLKGGVRLAKMLNEAFK